MPSLVALCMAIWLPRRLASTKPWAERMRQTSRPDSTRSLAKCDFDLGYVNLTPQTSIDLVFGSAFKE